MSSSAPPASAAPSGPPTGGVHVPIIHRRRFRDLLTQGAYVAVTALVFAYVLSALELRDFGFRIPQRAGRLRRRQPVADRC